MPTAPFHRHLIRTAFTAVASIGMIGGSFMVAAGAAGAVPASPNQYNLNQCANGGKGTLASCTANYVNADLHNTNSHWAEGDYVPFQLVLSDITKGQHTVTLRYENVANGVHAYDYLGSFDTTETTGPATAAHANLNDPCSTFVPGCLPGTPTDTLAITTPVLSGVNSACGSSGHTPAAPATGYFKLWGPANSTLDSMSYTLINQPTGNSDCSSYIAVNFTSPADGSTMVLAWGGHIASSLDWGPNNGAGSISGAPFHMWVDNLDGSPGSQERSIQVSASQPTMSTVIEDAAGTPVTSVPVNTPVHDTATLSGASSTAGGTVTYQFFNSSDCSGQAQSSTGALTVTKGVVPNSTTVTPSAAGPYSFLATYSGDAVNEPATAACEPLTVTEAPAALVDVVKSEVSPGDGQTVAPGQAAPIIYKLAVTNSGTADATNIVVTDAIPQGTTYVTGSAQPEGDVTFPTAGTIQWTIPTISAISGTTPTEVDLTFKVTVNSADADGSTITNQASFTNVNTPGCDGDTCLTNTVTNKVAVTQSGSNPQVPPATIASPPDTSVPAAATTPHPQLAFTGAHTGLLSLLGAGLIGSGGAILMLSRRRRSTTNS